eukprot:TRINITY_DN4851_c0_g1_i2.p1 TRINITY_DN4851_c0_g1~~TRINITY_DN4851_c0_g1_i2.p1  ORF type:complete len:120 (-),score=25.29 TRINITY_DN4851_c0_g1_i2:226-585(-)
MRDLYVKNGQGFLLVFSLVVKETLPFLEGVRDQIVKVKDTEDIPLCLIGNKADLVERRKIASTEGQEVADKSYKGKYFETSAKDGQNIQEVFDDIVSQITIKFPMKLISSRRKVNCILL